MTARPNHLSDGNPDGQVIGQSGTDKIAFYGATPITRPVVAAGNDATAVASMKAALVNLGLFTVAS
jgi:hypothetical protein